MKAARILLVEDELALGEIIRDTLETQNFEVIHISDGLMAYETYIEVKPDLVILDVMLPLLNGLQIAHAIRTKDIYIPILFLTAKSTTEDLLAGFRAGGNDYIKKPFDFDELIVRIEALLNRNLVQKIGVAETELVSIGLFEYDMKRNKLTLGERVIQLSAREGEVLATLFEHQLQMLPRKSLLLKVWKNDDFFSSRSLDVYISKLRSHLRKDPSVKIINHRGFGYRLVC
ncbi:DNA-binding response regulator [Dyadobacter luteus]|uniref:DNA-binding response regulator n=1 Tax=Dyadobacter luteus TaxID=2259619 RepID=A0A3D8Y4U8_9BACT|nr:response regulator transcription factor [Dyadobacter luteus]REA57399.1 DNA-binding response regulator [Dyadobacter luteus]